MNQSTLDVIQCGLSNVVNKYLSNDDKRWDAMYRQRYQTKMDSADQRPRHEVVHRILTEVFPRPGKLLDVGCGVGTSLQSHHSLLSHYHGIDLSQEAIAICRSKFGNQANCSFEAGNFLHKTFTGQFDAVLFNESLYYFPLQKIETVIAHARRALRPNGAVVISMSENPKSIFIWPKIDSLLRKFHDISVGTPERPGRWRVRSFVLTPKTCEFLAG
jgi:ubiquinone/menaquinone biosynthesis C-methylase UbiE